MICRGHSCMPTSSGTLIPSLDWDMLILHQTVVYSYASRLSMSSRIPAPSCWYGIDLGGPNVSYLWPATSEPSQKVSENLAFMGRTISVEPRHEDSDHLMPCKEFLTPSISGIGAGGVPAWKSFLSLHFWFSDFLVLNLWSWCKEKARKEEAGDPQGLTTVSVSIRMCLGERDGARGGGWNSERGAMLETGLGAFWAQADLRERPSKKSRDMKACTALDPHASKDRTTSACSLTISLHQLQPYVYLLWCYYLGQVWPFEVLLSGPSLLFYKTLFVKKTL